MSLIREHVSDEDFREALDRAPAGIIDPRSWAYWNSKMGRYSPPLLPKRHFGQEHAPGPDCEEAANWVGDSSNSQLYWADERLGPPNFRCPHDGLD